VSTTLAYILGIVILVIGIGVSVALHELGHMIPAKKFGVKVPEYFIGFGPKIWSFKRGETEYGVKAIWLGGYVKLVGMLPPARPGRPDRRRKDGSLGMVGEARGGAAAVGAGHGLVVVGALPLQARVTVIVGGRPPDVELHRALKELTEPIGVEDRGDGVGRGHRFDERRSHDPLPTKAKESAR